MAASKMTSLGRSGCSRSRLRIAETQTRCPGSVTTASAGTSHRNGPLLSPAPGQAKCRMSGPRASSMASYHLRPARVRHNGRCRFSCRRRIPKALSRLSPGRVARNNGRFRRIRGDDDEGWITRRVPQQDDRDNQSDEDRPGHGRHDEPAAVLLRGSAGPRVAWARPGCQDLRDVAGRAACPPVCFHEGPGESGMAASFRGASSVTLSVLHSGLNWPAGLSSATFDSGPYCGQ